MIHPMTVHQWWSLIAADVYRYHAGTGLLAVLRELLFGVGSKYSIWMRTTAFLRSLGPLALPLYVVSRGILKRLGIKYGLNIPWNTAIGPGLFIAHHGGIVVNDEAVIGRNCNLNHGVTIGISKRGRIGAPRIGDDVFLGTGCTVYGRVTVGDHTAIGPHAVVHRSIKPYSVVVPAPIEVIHCAPDNPTGLAGSNGWINRTDYARS